LPIIVATSLAGFALYQLVLLSLSVGRQVPKALLFIFQSVSGAFHSYRSPIPWAHWSAGLSSSWILWIRYTRKENRTIHEAHHRLGPVIRLGPNEVSVNCIKGGIQTVYSGGFEKHEWYSNLFYNYG
jgi:hypothetical protein